jgi:hypothetical protein
MRAVIAATLALLLTAVVVAPHVHLVATGEECAACVVRGGEVAQSRVPELPPLPLALGELVVALRSRLRDGAPQGAVPGQSPPRA